MSSTTKVTSDHEPRAALVDGHVHLYDCYRWGSFMEAAAASFAGAAATLGLDATTPGCLMLAETARDHAFDRLGDDHALLAPWRIEPTDEPCVVVAAHEGRRIAIVAGRQIVTGEGIEVLAQVTTATFDDGRPIDETIAAVLAAGVTPLLPWGVGKWHGRRGAIIDRLVSDTEPGHLLLGDNMHRPTIWPRPRQFTRAEARGIAVLPGTDPLPLPWQQAMPGRYGFVAPSFEIARPATCLRRLASAGRSPDAFGRRDSLPDFVRSQVELRRRPRPAAASGSAR